MSPPQPLRRELVGHVWVDHGGVAIVDQMYVDISDEDEKRILDGWTGALLDCGDAERLPDGVDNAGVWAATGLGDGRYPVYVDLTEVPGAGLRVARIVIDCLGTEAESASDSLREELVDVVHGLPDALRVTLPYDEKRVVEDAEEG
jgi:hypothetical protein